MDSTRLASMIDHTLLRQDAAEWEIRQLCNEVATFGFASACVNPIWVETACNLLENCPSLVCSVVGFPLGSTNSMPREAEKAVAQGAGEIDMVIPVGFLKSGLDHRAEEFIRDVVDSVPGIPVKVIIETCLLTDDEKITACRLARNAGAAWVKTSTGFAGGGATTADVRLMKSVVGDEMGVKASGGIRTLSDALSMIDAGAGRLGCSRSVQILRSMNE